MTLAWHYTTGVNFALIQRAERLLPTPIQTEGWPKDALAALRASARPILWFSTAQHFEPTARKRALRDGVWRVLTVAEMAQARGLVRLGISTERLQPWPQIGVRAWLPRNLRKQLDRAGAAVGAKPEHWYGSITPIALADCSVEVMDPSTLEWRTDYTRPAAADGKSSAR